MSTLAKPCAHQEEPWRSNELGIGLASLKWKQWQEVPVYTVPVVRIFMLIKNNGNCLTEQKTCIERNKFSKFTGLHL